MLAVGFPALLVFVAVLATAYLVGSIPFGYLVARWRGVDIFHQGSGNIGATNVGRVLGRRLGILVFWLDYLKGAGPTLAGLWLEPVLDPAAREGLPANGLGLLAGLGTFLGHLYPVYLRFRGGKGVATGAGIISVLVPGPALGAVICWVGVLCATRYVSLASLSAAAALSLLRVLSAESFAPDRLIITGFCFLAAALIFLRHRANLVRLYHGTENRIPEGPLMFGFGKTVHVLALGLWFGTAVFFSFFVALSIFQTLETTAVDAANRPNWFPLPKQFMVRQGPIDGPREQGTRAAGYVIGPLFDWYFLVQGVCGFLAVTTALPWPRFQPQRRVHRIRVALLLAALLTVLAGWPLERKVHDLRTPRNEAVDQYLQHPGAQTLHEAQDSKEEFGLWHLASVLVNLVTVVLVSGGMALAAQLPDRSPLPAQDVAGPKAERQIAGAGSG